MQKVIIKIANRKIVIKRLTDSTTSTTTTSGQTDPYKHTTWIPRWLKRRGNDRFHIVSTWNPRGVFVGIRRVDRRVLQVDKRALQMDKRMDRRVLRVEKRVLRVDKRVLRVLRVIK